MCVLKPCFEPVQASFDRHDGMHAVEWRVPGNVSVDFVFLLAAQFHVMSVGQLNENCTFLRHVASCDCSHVCEERSTEQPVVYIYDHRYRCL